MSEASSAEAWDLGPPCRLLWAQGPNMGRTIVNLYKKLLLLWVQKDTSEFLPCMVYMIHLSILYRKTTDSHTSIPQAQARARARARAKSKEEDGTHHQVERMLVSPRPRRLVPHLEVRETARRRVLVPRTTERSAPGPEVPPSGNGVEMTDLDLPTGRRHLPLCAFLCEF